MKTPMLRINARTFGVAILVGMAILMVVMVKPDWARIILPIWLIGFGATGYFLTSVIRTREEAERLESVLGVTSTSLASAGSRDQMYEAAVQASRTLLDPTDTDASATLVIIDKKAWKPAASTQSENESLRNQWRIETIITTIRGEGGREAENALRKRQQLTVAERSVLYIPLISLNEVHGAMIVEAQRILAPTVEAFTTISTQLALALEAAELSGSLNRQAGDRRYRALVEASHEATFIVNKSGHLLFASTAAERILSGVGQANDIFQVIHPKDRAAFVSMVQSAGQSVRSGNAQQSIECRVVSSGETRWIDVTATDMTREAEIEGIVITARDVTEKKLVESDLRHRVLHDDLTGISNAALLRERIEHALLMRRSGDSVAALLFVDLNDFKNFNEQLGKDAGDEILKVVAFRIDSFVRGYDTAARVGNDKFAVLLGDVASAEDVAAVANRLLKVVQMPLEFDGRNIEPKARIGICIAQPDYDAAIFQRNAEVAVIEAKLTPGFVASFSETMTVSATERMDLRRELNLAIKNDELTAFYQPIINLQTGNLAGFEALIRWIHPDRGLVSPGSFIPLAEETGLIVHIGAWVMYKACKQLNAWREQRPDLDLRMSINVSERQLTDRGFGDQLQRILRETETPPSAIVLELTETDALKTPAIREVLDELHHLGVGLAADDFGAGFASYNALQELPFTVAKIDRSLINGLASNFQKTSTQLRSVIEVAHSANLLVGAEGIEDDEQRALLASMGCDLGQGYYFGKPMPARDVDALVTESVSADAE